MKLKLGAVANAKNKEDWSTGGGHDLRKSAARAK
jgi:hypothetical protein